MANYEPEKSSVSIKIDSGTAVKPVYRSINLQKVRTNAPAGAVKGVSDAIADMLEYPVAGIRKIDISNVIE